jgi:hypothetical protein
MGELVTTACFLRLRQTVAAEGPVFRGARTEMVILAALVAVLGRRGRAAPLRLTKAIKVGMVLHLITRQTAVLAVVVELLIL